VRRLQIDDGRALCTMYYGGMLSAYTAVLQQLIAQLFHSTEDLGGGLANRNDLSSDVVFLNIQVGILQLRRLNSPRRQREALG